MNRRPEAFARYKIVPRANCISQPPCPGSRMDPEGRKDDFRRCFIQSPTRAPPDGPDRSPRVPEQPPPAPTGNRGQDSRQISIQNCKMVRKNVKNSTILEKKRPFSFKFCPFSQVSTLNCRRAAGVHRNSAAGQTGRARRLSVGMKRKILFLEQYLTRKEEPPCRRGARLPLFHVKQNKNKHRRKNSVFTPPNPFSPAAVQCRLVRTTEGLTRS